MFGRLLLGSPAGHHGTNLVEDVVVAGVREDGYREILGVRITDCENEAFWSGLFEDLKERGVTEVLLVIMDGHIGIQKTASAAFLITSWE